MGGDSNQGSPSSPTDGAYPITLWRPSGRARKRSIIPSRGEDPLWHNRRLAPTGKSATPASLVGPVRPGTFLPPSVVLGTAERQSRHRGGAEPQAMVPMTLGADQNSRRLFDLVGNMAPTSTQSIGGCKALPYFVVLRQEVRKLRIDQDVTRHSLVLLHQFLRNEGEYDVVPTHCHMRRACAGCHDPPLHVGNKGSRPWLLHHDSGRERQSVQFIQLEQNCILIWLFQANVRAHVPTQVVKLDDVGHVIGLLPYRGCEARHGRARQWQIHGLRRDSSRRHSRGMHLGARIPHTYPLSVYNVDQSG